jgi:hypothetical protein
MPDQAAASSANAEAAHARLRATLPVTERVKRLLPTRTSRSPAPRATRSSIWSESPASIADLVAYTAAGDWVLGEKAPVLEFLGKAYGYLVAVPVSVVLYAVAWLLQRPGRFALAWLVALVVWLGA